MEYGMLIKNGLVIDGNGTPGQTMDVRILDGKIQELGLSLEPRNNETVIDASGKVVAPGLIDSHSHADLDVLKNPMQEFDLCQGVTTELVGLCGLGFIPLSGSLLDEQMRYSAGLFGYDPDMVGPELSSFDAYMKAVDGAAINVSVAATHCAARVAVNGFAKEIPDRAAYEKGMRGVIEQAIEAGCVGMSTGLSYYPCAYADFDELVHIAKVLKEYNATFLTHIRYPKPGEPDSAIQEIIRVGEETGARIHILHYRTKYPYDAGNPQRLLGMFREANARGCDFTLETLPYLSGSTFIHAMLPGWVVEGGYEAALKNLQDPALRPRIIEEMQYLRNITALGNGKPPRFGHVRNHPEYSGAFIRDVQRMRNQDINEMLLDLLVESELDINYVGNEAEEDPDIYRTLMNDTLTMLQDPLYLCGSDAMPYGEYPHPRTSGCYAKMLRLSRELGIPLERVIQKLTANVADRFRMDQIGRIAPGKRADVIIFDPAEVTERSNFEDPTATAHGMEYVIIGGQIALRDDKPTGVRNGITIRKY